MDENVKVPWWQKTWVVVLACIFIPPAGLALLWVGQKGGMVTRVVLTVILGFYSLAWFGGIVGGSASSDNEPVAKTEVVAEDKVATETVAEEKKAAAQEAVAQPAAKTGINAEAFTSSVNSFAAAFNEQDAGLAIYPEKINVTDTGITATVDFALSDLSAWSVSDDTSKKEFINTIGQTINTMAVANCYDNKSTVGATVVLTSPSGLKLGEYTIWGNVKLEN